MKPRIEFRICYGQTTDLHACAPPPSPAPRSPPGIPSRYAHRTAAVALISDHVVTAMSEPPNHPSFTYPTRPTPSDAMSRHAPGPRYAPAPHAEHVPYADPPPNAFGGYHPHPHAPFPSGYGLDERREHPIPRVLGSVESTQPDRPQAGITIRPSHMHMQAGLTYAGTPPTQSTSTSRSPSMSRAPSPRPPGYHRPSVFDPSLVPGHVAPPQTHQSEVTQYLLDTINTLVTNIQSLNERVAHLESQIIDLNSQHADPPTAGSKPVDEHTSLLAFKMNDHTELKVSKHQSARIYASHLPHISRL